MAYNERYDFTGEGPLLSDPRYKLTIDNSESREKSAYLAVIGHIGENEVVNIVKEENKEENNNGLKGDPYLLYNNKNYGIIKSAFWKTGSGVGLIVGIICCLLLGAIVLQAALGVGNVYTMVIPGVVMGLLVFGLSGALFYKIRRISAYEELRGNKYN